MNQSFISGCKVAGERAKGAGLEEWRGRVRSIDRGRVGESQGRRWRGR